MKHSTPYSRIIAGTMSWGIWGKSLSTKEMMFLLHHCSDIGITTFDHADIYGDYTNEGQFGKAFSQSGIQRDAIQIISKCGIQMLGKNRSNTIKHYNYSKEYIIWSVERSLQELKTDYLDLLLLHRPSPLMRPEEVADAIRVLKIEGKIRQFGVSNFTPSQIQLLNTTVAVDANQVEFSLTINDAMYDGTWDDCMINDRMAMAWSPLGTFFKLEDPATKRIQKTLKQLGEKYNATDDQLLLAWILKHPAEVHPVVGTANPERLLLAKKAQTIHLDLEDWFMLLEASEGREVP